MRFNTGEFNESRFNIIDIVYDASISINGDGDIIASVIKIRHIQPTLIGSGVINTTALIRVYSTVELTGEGEYIAIPVKIREGVIELNGSGMIEGIPYAIYMPPNISLPTRFIIIDNTTKVVFI